MIILFKYCTDVENCESFRGFGYIYIYIYINCIHNMQNFVNSISFSY